MAVFVKYLFISLCLLLSLPSIGHTIYAQNDIPLLDNRFRIDPKTDQITFIFNHSEGYQRVILVRPDGSKIYQERHPENVAWISSEKENIVTIQKPMAGPWQALAKLDDNNRMQIISKVHLEVNHLPLKLYQREYITTSATLYEGERILKNSAYIEDAQLSISLIGNNGGKMALYQDDGKHYDAIAFDGTLTTRLYVDLSPDRYLLNISTQNDIFIRSVNKDTVVFPAPIKINITPIETGSDQARISFTIDRDEIEVNSVSIQGVIKNASEEVVSQVLIHNADNTPSTNRFYGVYKLAHNLYTFSGKAYATTKTGREIELQLADKIFELASPFKMPTFDLNAPVEMPTIAVEEIKPTSMYNNVLIIIVITLILLLVIATITFLIIQKIKKMNEIDAELIGELNFEELQSTQIELEDAK